MQLPPGKLAMPMRNLCESCRDRSNLAWLVRPSILSRLKTGKGARLSGIEPSEWTLSSSTAPPGQDPRACVLLGREAGSGPHHRAELAEGDAIGTIPSNET
jgi:hypothetical protein